MFALFLSAAPARAASALEAMPIGLAVNYHITTQTNKPPVEGGAKSTDNYLRIVRSSKTTFNVQLNGAPAGQLTVGGNGSLIVPQQLRSIFAPFREVDLLMGGAPQQLAPNSSWAATVPIPMGSSSDNVATVINVSQFSPRGANVVANGQNSTTVRPMIRQHPADVNFNASMTFNNARMLTFANSNISVAVRAGRFRTKHSSSSWTLSLANE